MLDVRSWLLASLFLVACSAAPPAASGRDERSEVPALAAQAQQLPIGARVVMGGATIELEVARSPREQAIGLMYRTHLPDDRGMLFPFEPAQPVSFWMKNVAIDLDMIFLRGAEVVAIAANVPPCTRNPCPLYGPEVPVDGVIELRGGRAAELGLQAGDRLQIDFLEAP